MLRNFESLRGCSLAASDGDIGKIREMYFDDETWVLRYLVITAGSWWAGRELLVGAQALGQVDGQACSVEVRLTRDEVRNAPAADTAKPVSRQFEKRYFQHHGWAPYWMGAMPIAGGSLPLPTGILRQSIDKESPPQDDLPHDPDQSSASQRSEGADEERQDPHLRSSQSVKTLTVHAQDGAVGSITDFILDDNGWSIPYLVIDASKWWAGKQVLVGSRWVEKVKDPAGGVFVSRARSTIQAAPAYDPAIPIDRAYEGRLHDHYGYKAYWENLSAV